MRAWLKSDALNSAGKLTRLIATLSPLYVPLNTCAKPPLAMGSLGSPCSFTPSSTIDGGNSPLRSEMRTMRLYAMRRCLAMTSSECSLGVILPGCSADLLGCSFSHFIISNSSVNQW
jgi:hypothetical protein